MSRLAHVVTASLVLVTLALPGRAEPLTPNRRYQGAAQLEVAPLGFGFALPAGYTGVLPAGTEWFHMGKDNEDGRVFLYADRMSQADMRALMSQPFPVAGVVMLTPTSPVREEAGALVADYSASDGAGQYGAEARVRCLASGVCVALVAVAPPGRLERYKAVAKQVAASLRHDVTPKAPAAGDVGSGPWASAIANKRVVKYQNASGYSEKTQFLVCGDGSFVRSFGATSVSVNGDGVLRDNDAGRWSVSGDQLTLRYTGGNVVTVTLEDRGGQLFIDGERWLREDYACR